MVDVARQLKRQEYVASDPEYFRGQESTTPSSNNGNPVRDTVPLNAGLMIAHWSQAVVLRHARRRRATHSRCRRHEKMVAMLGQEMLENLQQRVAPCSAGSWRRTAIMSQEPTGVGATTWSWVTVHQAIGMAMEYLNCSGLAAFETLITLAKATGQTVSDVSSDIVERRVRLA